jgi:hypothetical protein
MAAWTAWRFSITPPREVITKSVDRGVRMVVMCVVVLMCGAVVALESAAEL